MSVILHGNVLKHLFRDVYFLNGTAYAGKSTMARMLAEKHGGILLGENYHDALRAATDAEHQPNLHYFHTMSGWQEFIGRTPEQYDAWIEGCSREAEDLEIALLIRATAGGRKVFVDTNLSIETLRTVSDARHVAFLIAPQATAMERFFDREDEDKAFLLEQIRLAPDPERAMSNFRACIARINRPEKAEAFAQSGFFTLRRDDARTPEQTLALLEEHFGLC